MNEGTDSDRRQADVILRALRRTRQVRQFTDEPVAEADLEAILNVARWSGSASNRQPWTFMVLRGAGVRRRFAELAPSARHLEGAPVGVAIAMPGENAVMDAFDEARVAERILIAAGVLGLGAAIGWAGKDREAIGELLGLTPPAYVRTVISIGHPTEAAEQPKSAPGAARRPLSELVREL